VRCNRFEIRSRNSRSVGFGIAPVRASFELFSLVSGASEIGEAIPEVRISANIISLPNFGFLDI
jgi:hypothetical protein